MSWSKDDLKNIADNPIDNGKLTHLKVDINTKVPELFFLPGDPSRLELFEEIADEFVYLNENREFRSAIGKYNGREFGVCSTGIGGGSAEIAVTELHLLGIKKLVRVGGCGAIQEEIDCGDVIINTGAVRLGGSSSFYVRPEFPAVADPFMVCALADSAKSRGFNPHTGIGATVNSYYEGQGRSVTSRKATRGEKIFMEMREAGVLNYDMETETIFTLAYLLGMRAANILAVHGNRITNMWLTKYREAQLSVIEIALKANL